MDHEQKIIRYLDGELQEEELRLFEQAMEEDADLARQVREFRRLQEIAKETLKETDDTEAGLDGETLREITANVSDFKKRKKTDPDVPEHIRRRMEQAALSYFRKTQPGMKRILVLWYSLAAVIIAGGILSAVLFKPFMKLSPAELYAFYFSPYSKTEQVIELTRSDDDFLFAVEVYEARDYERASLLFRMLADSSGIGDYARLYLGLTQMGLNRTDEAIISLETVEKTGSGELLQDARWYLALSYLKAGMPEQAGDLLKLIMDSGSSYKTEAKRILRDMR